MVDLFISVVGLILLSPVILLAAITILLTSKGWPIYGHRRAGLEGREFNCYKIRTMYLGVPLPDEFREQFEKHYKIQNDPRITPVGRLLRKASIDEIPQLWNVLRGQMSIVGPRPVTSEELNRMFGSNAALVTSVRPGITGLWQVSGRSNMTYDERIELDIQYVKNLSIANDMIILLKTVPAVLDFDSTS